MEPVYPYFESKNKLDLGTISKFQLHLNCWQEDIMDPVQKSLEWKYIAAYTILVEEGHDLNIKVLGEGTECSAQLTDKQLKKKLNSLPQPLPGEQNVYFDGQLKYPEQEINIRLLNLKAFLLENGISTYLNNIHPPEGMNVRDKCTSWALHDCLNFVQHHFKFLRIPKYKDFEELFQKKMTKKLRKQLLKILPTE